MKYWFVLLLFFLSACFVQAQDISVVKFQKLENDLDARVNAPVLDQNGKKCALLKVVTIEKGFTFDVGQLGVVKTVYKPAEVWVYVPKGVNKIKITHPKLGQIKSDDGYYWFPEGGVEDATCYRMEITTNKIIEAIYDDSRKQKLFVEVRYGKAAMTLNGMKIALDYYGKSTQELSFGTYKYKVEVPGYYPKEGTITINDPKKAQTLVINDLKPIMGKIKVKVSPPDAKLYIDEKEVRTSTLFVPYELQVGTHSIQVSANGYKTETKIIEIKAEQTTELVLSLSRTAKFTFETDPSGASVSVDGAFIGKTPCSTQLATGTYRIKAEKSGYKNYEAYVKLNSATPYFKVPLRKIYNKKYELYLEVNSQIACWKRFMTVGATLGGFIYNVNIEAAYFYGFGKSENIYWCGSDVYPISATYKPMSGILKVGYGFPLGTRFRIVPQFGLSLLKLSEKLNDKYSDPMADGAYAENGIVSIRFSAVVVNHLALTVTPEYAFKIKNSRGYNLLSEVSPKIKCWEKGVSIKLGVAVFFYGNRKNRK